VKPVLMEVPVPKNPEFVARCRAEIQAADERAYAVLKKSPPPKIEVAPEPEPEPEPEPTPEAVEPTPVRRKSGRPRGVTNEGVAERREKVLCGLMCGQTLAEIGADLGVSRGIVDADAMKLREQYGARNAHHLTALATLELTERMVKTRDMMIAEYQFRQRLAV
jgi:DNA-binding CsgD family transcriptional regulator